MRRQGNGVVTTVLIAAVFGIVACSAVDQPMTFMEALQCNLNIYVNGALQATEVPFNAELDPSELVTSRQTEIKLAFNSSVFMESVYIKINSSSVKAYCYNDSAPTVVQPFGPLLYNGDLIKAVTNRIGGLPACESIPGCDGFTLATLVFYRQFPAACTRFRIDLNATFYKNPNATIPFDPDIQASTPVHIALSSVGASAKSDCCGADRKVAATASILSKLAGSGSGKKGLLKAQALDQQHQQSTTKINHNHFRALSEPPADYEEIGTTDYQTVVTNSTAEDRRLAHATDESTTSLELSLFIPLGVLGGILFIAFIIYQVNAAGKAAATAAAAAASASSTTVSGHASHERQSFISRGDSKRSDTAEMTRRYKGQNFGNGGY